MMDTVDIGTEICYNYSGFIPNNKEKSADMKNMMRKGISILCTLALLMSFAHATEKKNVRVAVIDTGVSTAAISSNSLSEGKNYILPGESTEDLVGHGTAIASIIVGSESAKIPGVCPDAEIVPLVFYSMDASGKKVAGNLDMIAGMIVEAIDVFDCDIINISSYGMLEFKELEQAVAYAEEKGVLIVSAAGNEGTTSAYYPGSYDSVLTVGTYAEDGTDAAYFSNRHQFVDVLAPGIDLPVADLTGAAATQTGTSFSTAYISGLAAKLLTMNPDLNAAQLRQIICASAEDILNVGFDHASGWGCVNEDAAMQYVADGRVYRDVKAADWYYDGAMTMTREGLMRGVDAIHFGPQQTTSRAMLWVMLHRMDGQSESANALTWYYDAQIWVMESGISDGMDANGTIPREEIALTLWRYAQYKGMDVDQVTYDLSAFPDASSVSAEAVAAMKWACGTGLINGMDGRLAPTGNTTRAQMATILTRFVLL